MGRNRDDARHEQISFLGYDWVTENGELKIRGSLGLAPEKVEVIDIGDELEVKLRMKVDEVGFKEKRDRHDEVKERTEIRGGAATRLMSVKKVQKTDQEFEEVDAQAVPDESAAAAGEEDVQEAQVIGELPAGKDPEGKVAEMPALPGLTADQMAVVRVLVAAPCSDISQITGQLGSTNGRVWKEEEVAGIVGKLVEDSYVLDTGHGDFEATEAAAALVKEFDDIPF